MIAKTTYSDARANFGALMDRVIADNDIVVISRENAEDVALISAAELASLQETAHLFRSPKNAARLTSALKRARSKKTKPSSVEQLRRDVGM